VLTAQTVPRVLIVTNDFPPRVGGVQQYVSNLARHLPSECVAVLAPNWDGWREHDAAQPFPVHRWPARFLWPTRDLGRRTLSLAREHQADVVLFGHGLPAPLIGPEISARGYPYVVLTHGTELWLARSPVLAAAMWRAMSEARAVTAVSEYLARAVRRITPEGVAVTVLHPGVDTRRFAPAVEGAGVRERHGLQGKAVIMCVSRLVPRKGQDVLIRGMKQLRRSVPDATLLIVGDGPFRVTLETLAAEAPSGSVIFAGQVPDHDLPAHYAACDVFAMPCRTRWAGLEVEGFGIVFLEAAAAGRAVVAGRSGGAAEAVVDEQTGLLVEGGEHKAVALTLARLLTDPGFRGTLGGAGRRRVERSFTWEQQAERLAELLRQAAG
jgi:phosphatidylinositol alpha-1,6-mannosyltransferase